MATGFGVDPVVARQLAGELAEVRGTLNALGDAFDGMAGLTGSSEVEKSLDGFVKHSSDSRDNLDQLLERGAGLLSGLAEGAAQVDGDLAGVLEPVGPPGGVARPSEQVVPVEAVAAGSGAVPVVDAQALGGSR